MNIESAPTSGKVWSVYQQAIFSEVSEGTGHAVIVARAGSGKTTTVVHALECVPRGRTVLMAAFNTSIKDELKARAPKGVEVKTMHSHGLSAVKRAFRNAEVTDEKSKLICQDLWGDPRNAPISYAAIAHLVRVAKDTLIGYSEIDKLDAAIDAFNVDAPDLEEERKDLVARAARVLQLSSEPKYMHMIDFSDMCWLPVILGLRVWQFDYVFVDETQDLCPSQIALLLMCVKPHGRIIAVGDDRQAIYAFRGADAQAMPKLIEELRAKVLPLSVTYRCARAIVNLARTEVPDLEAAPDAPDGEINHVWMDDMVAKAAPGDMIISRTNAPLLGLALGFIKDGRRAVIKGRDIGQNLVRMIRKSKAETIEALLEWMQEWHARETARLAAKGRNPEEATDKLECIEAICDGAKSIGEVLARCESLFTDIKSTNVITLGTTHKLKGLEANRVWMLADTYKRGRRVEESNLWYVAVTRAKTSLNFVRKPQNA